MPLLLAHIIATGESQHCHLLGPCVLLRVEALRLIYVAVHTQYKLAACRRRHLWMQYMLVCISGLSLPSDLQSGPYCSLFLPTWLSGAPVATLASGAVFSQGSLVVEAVSNTLLGVATIGLDPSLGPSATYLCFVYAWGVLIYCWVSAVITLSTMSCT